MELEAASYCTACTGGKDVESLLPLIASEMADAVGIFFLFFLIFFVVHILTSFMSVKPHQKFSSCTLNLLSRF